MTDRSNYYGKAMLVSTVMVFVGLPMAILSACFGGFIMVAGMAGLIFIPLIDIATAKNDGNWKLMWGAAVFLLSIFGIVAYHFIGRKSRNDEIDAAKRTLEGCASVLPQMTYKNGKPETAVFSNIKYIEERADGKWISGGASVKVATGVWARMNQGHYEPHSELKVIDVGQLRVSKHAIVFTGQMRNLTMETGKVNHIGDMETQLSATGQAVVVGVSNRQKLAIFDVYPPLFLIFSGSILFPDFENEQRAGLRENFMKDINGTIETTAVFKEGEQVPVSKLEKMLSCLDLGQNLLKRNYELYETILEKKDLTEAKAKVEEYCQYVEKTKELLAKAKKDGAKDVAIPFTPKAIAL